MRVASLSLANAKIVMPTKTTMPQDDYLRAFIDTEFTDFQSVKMISFALVAEDGRALYCELSDTWSTQDCSDFVIEVVLPLLGPLEKRLTAAQARQAVKAWVEALCRPVMLYSDSVWHDETAFLSLFTGHMEEWPSNLYEGFVDFKAEKEIDFAARGLREHHALDDALALRDAYLQS